VGVNIIKNRKEPISSILKYAALLLLGGLHLYRKDVSPVALRLKGKRAAGTGNLFHCPARRGKPGSPLSHVSWGGVRRLSLSSEAKIYGRN